MTGVHKANRLINSTSPYLKQHAYNPVDWYEWSEEAMTKAKTENKPILVSIGYSSCHWCHVMEREVFEKDEMAQVMNQNLVCIKVDREERPDIDSIYMEAVQMMGIQGGWPLNVFLTPDQKPFYGGTYFPPDQWLNVVRGVDRAFKERRSEVNSSAEELAKALASHDTAHFKKVQEFIDLKTDLNSMYTKLSATFDTKWGGLDKAPKFVMPSVWLWLLRYQHLTKNKEALQHLDLTLRKIAWGGIYDQLGGGFARYSVDAYWFVPHFEKMLYDNGQLMSLYSEMYVVTKDPLYKNIIGETFDWLQGEMMNSKGGFYSALDADSEGVEGKFYVWSKKEIIDTLGTDAEAFIDYYNVKDEGNWEHGNNILIITQPENLLLQKYNISPTEWPQKLRQWKDTLIAVRDQRIRPGLDDKVITSWNAIMVVGLVDAYKCIGENRYLDAALKNMRFIENELMDGLTIYRSYKEKRSNTKGFLDDYAFVIQACVRLYQVTFDEYWVRRAEALTEYVIAEFHDKEDGFFFYTSNESEPLIARRKEIFDNVIPSSNSVMVQNLIELGTLLARDEWIRLAESITTPLAHLIVQEPNYMSNWAIAYTSIRERFAEVVLAGKDTRSIALKFFQTYQPFSVLMGSHSKSTLPLTEGKAELEGRDTIYVCYDRTCRKPVHSVDEAIEQINEKDHAAFS
jgi:uncharacterized protein